MSLTVQTEAVKNAIALLGTKIRDISVKADNAPNAQLLEGYTVQGIHDLISGTTGASIADVEAALNTHIARRDNPHLVTQSQVGLGLVDNFATATVAEGTGTVYSYTAAAGQTSLSGTDDNALAMDLSTQPGVYVTKNIGDALAEGTDYTVNYATSTITLLTAAIAGDVYEVRAVVNNKFIVSNVMWSALETFWGDKLGSTPDALNTIQELAAALTNNPDVVANLTDLIATKATQSDIDTSIGLLTKADIGLGNVQDYTIATQAEVLGESYTYTAAGDQTAFSGADNSSNVLNFVAGATIEVTKNGAPVAFVQDDVTDTVTLNIAAAASDVIVITVFDNDTYVTPASNKAQSQAVEAELQAQINTKTAQTDHDALQTQVDTLTKADISLGSVENYGIATQAEAEAKSVDNKYMTPLKTGQSIEVTRAALQANINLKTDLTLHNALQTQVDNLTKADIGLGLVENHAIATEAESVGSDYSYTATAGQTAFSGADNAAQTLTFEADAVAAVDVNGGAVAFTKDAATNTITLASAATAGDLVSIKVSTNDAYMTPAGTLGVRKEIDAEVTTALSEIEAAFNQAIADIGTV